MAEPTYENRVRGFLINKGLQQQSFFPKHLETQLMGLVMEYAAQRRQRYYAVSSRERDTYTFTSTLTFDDDFVFQRAEVDLDRRTREVREARLFFPWNKGKSYAPGAFDLLQYPTPPLVLRPDTVNRVLRAANEAQHHTTRIPGGPPRPGYAIEWDGLVYAFYDKQAFLDDVEMTWEYFVTLNWALEDEYLARQPVEKKKKQTKKRKTK